jgi:excisionase family DNA binding protein
MLTKEEMGKDMDSMDNNGQMDDMLTVREVARLLHVHPNTLRRWSNSGRIKAYRITPRGDRRTELGKTAGQLPNASWERNNWFRLYSSCLHPMHHPATEASISL